MRVGLFLPAERFFFDPITKDAYVDTVLSSPASALVGGPARQDHLKAIDSLKKLNVPYMVTVPLSFQTTRSGPTTPPAPCAGCAPGGAPELDGGLEPIIFSGRDSKTGKSHPAARADAGRALKGRPPQEEERGQEVRHHCLLPPDKGNAGTAAYLNVFASIFRVLQA